MGHVAWMEEGRSACKILTGKPTGNRPLGRPRCRWEDNIKMDQYEELGWFNSEWEFLESPCECSIEPPGSIGNGVSYLFNLMYIDSPTWS